MYSQFLGRELCLFLAFGMSILSPSRSYATILLRKRELVALILCDGVLPIGGLDCCHLLLLIHCSLLLPLFVGVL